MAASAGAAFEESIASYDLHAQRQFELEQARALVARNEEQRRIAGQTLGAPDQSTSLAALSRSSMPVYMPRQAAPGQARPGQAGPLAAIASNPEPDTRGQQVAALATGRGAAIDAETAGIAPAQASPYNPAGEGGQGFDIAPGIGGTATPPATELDDARIREQANQASADLRAQAQSQADAKAIPVSSKLMDIASGNQQPGMPQPGMPNPANPGTAPGGPPGGPAAPGGDQKGQPQQVPSAPELQTLAQVAPIMGDREVKDSYQNLIHQSGTDFNSSDRLTEYAKAVARVNPEASIAALTQAGVLRNRAWDNEEKLLNHADVRFTKITELAETVVDQASLDRAHMIAGARGFDSSMFPNDFQTAKPVLDQMVQSVQKSKGKIEDLLKSRRMDIDQQNANNRAELNAATADLKDAQAAKAQSETGVKAKEAEIKQQKVDNQKEIDGIKAEQKDRELAQKELDKAISQGDKKAKLVTSILSPYINQSKGAAQLANGVRASVNYMTDLQADDRAESPSKDLTLIHTFVDTMTDVKSRGSIREIDAVRSLEGMPTNILKHFNKLVEGQTLLDYERKEIYDAMMERYRPINDSQIALEESYKKRLVDAKLPLDYFIQYSVPEATAAMGAGRNSPNPVSANTEAELQGFKFRLDPAAPESENLAKINSIRNADERKAVMDDYRKLKSRKGGDDSFPIPSPEAIEYVRKHPEKTKDFVDHYGPNALTKGN